jgi:flagellar motor switch protein FliN/FliY
MMTERPLTFLPKIEEQLQTLGMAPQAGQAPILDLQKLSQRLQDKLQAPELTLSIHRHEWIQSEEIPKLAICPLIVAIYLTPLKDKIYWMMDQSDVDSLTSSLFFQTEEHLYLLSNGLREGFYRYLTLQTLQALSNLPPFDSLTLTLGDEAELPLEPLFITQVSIAVPGKLVWGHILATPSLHTHWIQHFASLKHRYFPTPLTSLLPLDLGLKVGQVTLEVNQWDTLLEGDFIYPDTLEYNPFSQTGVATLSLLAAPLFLINLGDKGAQVTNYARYQDETIFMRNTNSETLTPIQKAPLQIDIEISKIQMPLDDLLKLHPGQILSLPQTLDAGVYLAVQGKRVGRGELVQLGDTLGIRILELGS